MSEDTETKKIKRYIGAVTEDFTEKVETIGEQFSGLNKKIDRNAQKIDKNAEKIDKNAQKIAENRKMIAQVAEDVTDIKQELKKKVDYEEFDALKKRVVDLEQEVAK